MRLADDRRGRVPFALLGVLVLLGASTYAADLGTRGPTPVDREADALLDGVERDLRPALRVAVERAAVEAARRPVTVRADTPAGRTLNGSTPFEDALRVRIAVAAADALDHLGRTRGGLSANASFQPTRVIISAAWNDSSMGNASMVATDPSVDQALRRVVLRSVDGGRAMRVTLQDIRVAVWRDGRVVASRVASPTLTVRVPVLAMHRLVARYERRLNRGPLEGPGLGRELTARLYPVVWARAYGQYGGAPIENVLGNRHVELSTNAALLREQRAVFGRVDPDGRRALAVGTTRVGVTDLLGPTLPRGDDWTRLVLRPNAVDDGATTEWSPPPVDRQSLTVGTGDSADRAYLATIDESTLARILARSYRVTARLRTTVTAVRDGEKPRADPPGSNWTLARETVRLRVTVTGAGGGPVGPADLDGAGPEAGVGLGSAQRSVAVRHRVTWTWIHPSGKVATTVGSWSDRYRVTISVVGTYSPDGRLTERATRPLFRTGGALDGPNLRDVPGKAWARLVADEGGADRLARRVATGEPVDRTAVVEGRQPPGLSAWVEADLRRLHRRLLEVEVTVDPRRVAAGEANPAARLAALLGLRRDELVDAPATYDGAADRARVAARAALVDAVVRRLEERAAATRARNGAYVDVIGERSSRRLSRFVAVAASGRLDPEENPGAPTLRPDSSPAYLTLAAVEHGTVPSVAPGTRAHPLVAETTNWFALPYGDAAAAVGGGLFGGERVRLRTAAQALVAADRALETHSDAALRERRAVLRARVSDSLDHVERRAVAVTVDATGLSRGAASRAVTAALGGWRTPGRRALAATNGSLATAIAHRARERGVPHQEVDVLAVRLRVALRDARETTRVRVPARATNRTASATRRVARAATTELVAAGLGRGSTHLLHRWAGLRARTLPAGLPVAPVPGYWYATVNAWSVTVRGEYRRFAVGARVGPPDGAGAVVTYVRDGSAVRLDVDDDGERELLGYAARVGFETGTTVVVAVPPGPPGVGDVDGDRVERSPGWPCPGVDGREGCPAAGTGDESPAERGGDSDSAAPPTRWNPGVAVARDRIGNRFPAGSPTG